MNYSLHPHPPLARKIILAINKRNLAVESSSPPTVIALSRCNRPSRGDGWRIDRRRRRLPSVSEAYKRRSCWPRIAGYRVSARGAAPRRQIRIEMLPRLGAWTWRGVSPVRANAALNNLWSNQMRYRRPLNRKLHAKTIDHFFRLLQILCLLDEMSSSNQFLINIMSQSFNRFLSILKDFME